MPFNKAFLVAELLGLYLDVLFEPSNGAEGFLAVYWDDLVLGTLDQRYLGSIENWFLPLPEGYGSIGLHTLGFRLDNYGSDSAGVVISSIGGLAVLQAVPVPEPSVLLLVLIGLLAFGVQARTRRNYF